MFGDGRVDQVTLQQSKYALERKMEMAIYKTQWNSSKIGTDCKFLENEQKYYFFTRNDETFQSDHDLEELSKKLKRVKERERGSCFIWYTKVALHNI